jgi:hypothetical protein
LAWCLAITLIITQSKIYQGNTVVPTLVEDPINVVCLFVKKKTPPSDLGWSP